MPKNLLLEQCETIDDLASLNPGTIEKLATEPCTALQGVAIALRLSELADAVLASKIEIDLSPQAPSPERETAELKDADRVLDTAGVPNQVRGQALTLPQRIELLLAA